MNVLLILALISSFSFPSLGSLKNIELALNWKAEPEFGGFYAASDFLKKEGLSMKIIEGGSGTPTIQMLAAKKVSFAIVSADELVIARDKGMDLVALFAVYQENPQGIMVREDSPWKTLEQLLNDAKATVAVQIGLPYVAYLKKTFPKLKAKLVPYQGGLTLFLSQKNYAQQAFLTAEPLLAQKSGVKTRGFSLDEVGFKPYLAVLAVHGETLKQSPDLVRKVVEGVRQGWEHYLSQPEATDLMMSQLNPSMSLETFKESGKLQSKLIKPTSDFKIGQMSEERWKTLSLQLKDLRLIKKTQDPKNYFYQ